MQKLPMTTYAYNFVTFTFFNPSTLSRSSGKTLSVEHIITMTITYGIIGTNWITDTWITAAAKTGKWKLHGVYSRTLEQAKSFGAKYDCSRCFTTLESIASDPELQFIYIASPNSLHYAQAKQMLQAGKNVLLEKPATCTVAELDELFAIAKAKDLYLIEAYRHIQEANFKKLEKMLHEEKKLGTIYGASLTWATWSSRYNNVLAGEKPNIFNLEFGGGSLVDVGVYPITFAVTLFGVPKSQTYIPYVCATGVDAGGMIILRYDSFGVSIDQSKAWQSTAPSEIYGENGTIALDATGSISSMTYWDPKTKKTEELAGPKAENMMEEEAAAFARLIEEKDLTGLARLEEISKMVLQVTTSLRHENGLLYPADKK